MHSSDDRSDDNSDEYFGWVRNVEPKRIALLQSGVVSPAKVTKWRDWICLIYESHSTEIVERIDRTLTYADADYKYHTEIESRGWLYVMNDDLIFCSDLVIRMHTLEGYGSIADGNYRSINEEIGWTRLLEKPLISTTTDQWDGVTEEEFRKACEELYGHGRELLGI
jgi:hypothetical protein